jgi:hypothetical protein
MPKYKVTCGRIDYEPKDKAGKPMTDSWQSFLKGETIDTELLPTKMPIAELLEDGRIKEA